MKPDYFNQLAADTDDPLLQTCIQQGWVTPYCLNGGKNVMEMKVKNGDACRQCRGPRHLCGGRPFMADTSIAHSERLNLGSAASDALDGSNRFFFLGGDTAPSESHRSDHTGLVGGVATPRNLQLRSEAGGQKSAELELSDNPANWWFDFVYARRLTSEHRASAGQISGVIHGLHQQFAFEKIMLDFNGGGQWVQRELKRPDQFINGAARTVTPIADTVTGPMDVTRGYFILHLYFRGDPGLTELFPGPNGKALASDDLLNDAAYSDMKTALDTTGVGLPPRVEDLRLNRPDEMKLWTPERVEALVELNLMVEQFKNLAVLTDEAGQVTTRRGARQFAASGKKDLMSAAVYCYLAFRIWLVTQEWKHAVKPANRPMFSSS